MRRAIHLSVIPRWIACRSNARIGRGVLDTRIRGYDGLVRSRHLHVIVCDKREAFAQGSESDEAIHLSAWQKMDCFAEPVIGLAFARAVGSQ